MKRSMLLVVPFAIVHAALAQFPYTRVIEVRSGQRRPAISQVVQDEQGLIWVGSDMGLLRTDGERVDMMLRTENTGVNALCAAGHGVIAALGTGMLVRCDAMGCDTLWNDTLLRSAPVRALVEDDVGRIWIGTYGNGVIVLDKGKASMIKGLPEEHVNDLCATSEGRVVVATDQGLALCAVSGVLEVFGEAEGAPDNLVLSIAVTPAGDVWAGTDRSGAFRWTPGGGRGQLQVLDSTWTEGPVRSVQVVDDLVWVGTQDHGVVMVDRGPSRGSYISARTKEERSNPVLDLLVDRDGAVWWCDGTEQLHRADPAILFVPEHEGLDLRHISALCDDVNDRIWFATPRGLFSHAAAFAEELKVTQVPLHVDPLTPIVSMAAAADGTIWAATFGSGVYVVPPVGTIRHITRSDGLSNDNVLSVEISGDRVWLATLDGLNERSLAGGPWMVHALPGPGFVYDLLPADNGGVLAATDGQGVLAFEPGPQGATRALKNLASRTFYSLVRDASGAVWAGGPGTGFCRLDEKVASCSGAERPPFDDDLFAMAAWHDRLIAFGSTGTTTFDPASDQWTDISARFGLDGMKAELNALCTDRQGALWLASDKGLVRMRPTAGHFDPRIQAVIIGAQVGNEVVTVNGSLRTSHDRSDITIQFTGLHYADPGIVRFEYRMLGLDQRAIRTRDREVSYSSLRPGNYRFQVRAFAGDAPVSDEWTTLDITVDAPWWRLQWVVAIGAVLIFIAVFSLLRARDRRLRYRERMEQEQVRFQLEALRSQVDPHFLFNSFNALVEMIESDPAKAVEHVDQLSVFFRNILLVRDRERITLDEELALVENYFALEQRRFGGAIQLELQVGAKERQRGIVPLTLQMLVENALKHNVIDAGRPFIVSISTEQDTVIIHNPLRPRLSPPRSTGFGLDSITKRYKALTTRPILVDRADDHFTVRIPLIDP